MRYAIASDGVEVSPHFGRCQFYELVDVAEGAVIGRERMANPGHAPGQLPMLMQQRQVDYVVCGGAGPRAQGILNDIGIGLIVGVSGTMEDAIAAIAAGDIESGEDTCHHT
jgi:predicted Fe-Mo cluster-binding NifX family protein